MIPLLIAIFILLVCLLTPDIIYFIHKENFEWRNKEIKKEKQTNQDFTIEYMPLSGRYYPKHKGRYLYYWMSGKWETKSEIGGAEYSLSEKSAKKRYQEFLKGVGITSIILKPEI